MLNENDNVNDIKSIVLTKVAKLAFEGQLGKKIDSIPFELIPGPQAKFRCCIYREREIIRQRVRLAQGKSPSQNKDNKNIVQVINSACEGCPITRFVVTENCQKCVGKRCQQSCNFHAITMLHDRAYIDPSKCRECGKCKEACPYNAIADLMRPCKRSCPVDAITMDENNIVVINEEKCINCGACIKDCPFGAISDRSFIVDIINLINLKNIPIYAMVAPAAEGQFSQGISMGMLAEGIKALGFTDMFEVAFGADLTAAEEAKEWLLAYQEGLKKTTSCCPAFVNMIRKHFSELVPNISNTLSPMNLLAKHIKQKYPDALTVFIGPCIAKKGEVLDTIAYGCADYALTFEELNAMLRAKDIDLTLFHGEKQEGSIYGKRFAQSGGVTAAVLQAVKEMEERKRSKVRQSDDIAEAIVKEENVTAETDVTQGEDTTEIAVEQGDGTTKIQVKQCDGAIECKKALLLLKSGRMQEDFIEGMSCVGGCINGPGSIANGPKVIKAREELLKKADKREIIENVNNGIHVLS